MRMRSGPHSEREYNVATRPGQFSPASIRSAFGRWLPAMMTPARLLMATKAALAAALAWFLAPFLPFTDDQYSYYAPLGVLVSLYPTVAASARSGVQALLGLAIGIGLGLLGVAAGFAGIPPILTLAVVVGVGVLFGGIAALGEGRGWVAIAALFVLLLSGREVEEFSLSYLLTMAFGIFVGVVVNLAIVPPLYLRRASGRLSVLRDTISSSLTTVAEHLRTGDAAAAALEAEMRTLDATMADVRGEVYEADESRKANPRARRHRVEQEQNLQRLHALERTVFYTRDLADVIVDLDTDSSSSSVDARTALARAVNACGDLVATPVDAEESQERLADAQQALEDYLVTLHRATGGQSSFAADELTPAACLRRIIDASLPFVRTTH